MPHKSSILSCLKIFITTTGVKSLNLKFLGQAETFALSKSIASEGEESKVKFKLYVKCPSAQQSRIFHNG